MKPAPARSRRWPWGWLTLIIRASWHGRGTMGEVTVLVQRAAAGDRAAFDAAYAAIHGELKVLARRRLHARPGSTLSPTMLVNEVWLKLAAGVQATERTHFFRIAAQAMRQIWIDRLRARSAESERIRLYAGSHNPDAPSPTGTDDWIELVDWESALKLLAETDPELAELVDLRIFSGLELPEVAELKGCSLRTVQRQWSTARAFLRKGS